MTNRPMCLRLLLVILAMDVASARHATAQSELIKSTISYREVDGHRILADIYRPKGDEVRPVIVWFHGGALINGNRERINSQVLALAEEEQYALVSVDYRLAPETKLPEIIDDIEAAFRWLGHDGAKAFHLDPNKIVAAGESAGGYLALVSGYRVQPRPSAIVALYGYGSLTGDWYTKPSAQPRHNATKISRDEALRQTDGVVVSDHRLRKGNGSQIYLYYRQNGLWPVEVSGFDRATIADRIAAYEPLRNIAEDYPPTLLIHGTDDTDVPYAESAMFAERLKDRGISHSLVTVEKGEHGLGGAEPAKVKAAFKTMREFIAAHLSVR